MTSQHLHLQSRLQMHQLYSLNTEIPLNIEILSDNTVLLLYVQYHAMFCMFPSPCRHVVSCPRADQASSQWITRQRYTILAVSTLRNIISTVL